MTDGRFLLWVAVSALTTAALFSAIIACLDWVGV